MPALSIQPTYPIFTDIDGQPLENGYVWIGTANLDPQSNPINVYWDDALTQLAAQPIRTRGGYPVNAGTPARLYVNSDYSIRVTNKNGAAIYNAPEATERISSAIISQIDSSEVSYTPAGTGAVATNVQSKLRESVSAKDFGAVGDGVTDDTVAIQAAINALTTGQTLVFPGGNYKLTAGLNIANKSRIRITGKARLFLSGASSSAYIFLLVGTIDDLEIDGLTLVGENNPAYSQGAIGCNSGQTISNTRFHDLNISNINVGISHNAYSGGSWTRGFCYNNYLKDLVGDSPGQGYGIHMAKASQIQVYDNIIDNASRHAIYQGAGVNCNNIITSNTILNHRSTVAAAVFRCAISCSRSTGVTITNNRIVDFYDGALEVAHETSSGFDCSNILVSNNAFINRKNAVPAILVGEQLLPTTNTTSKIEIVSNEFDEDVTVATGTTISIMNGNNIIISNNRFRRYNVTTVLSQILELGNSTYATSDAHIGNITVTNNDATSDVAVASTRFAYVSTQLCTGSSSYVIKDNFIKGFSNEFFFQATPTNINSKLKFQVSWTNDFASVAANSTFGGAYNPSIFFGMKPTSMVTVRPQQSINTRMAFNMFPSDTGVNTLYVWLFNTTASAIDWPSTTFIVNVEDI